MAAVGHVDDERSAPSGRDGVRHPPRVVAIGGATLRRELESFAPTWAEAVDAASRDLEHTDVVVIEGSALRSERTREGVVDLAQRVPLLIIDEEATSTRVPSLPSGAGAVSVMVRPCDRAELQRRIDLLAELRRLRRALRVIDAALEHSVSGLAIADARKPDKPLVYVSPVFERMTGYRASDVLDRNCRFLKGPDTSPEASQKIRDAIANAEPARVLVENYRKDGRQFWNELTVFPIEDHDGELLYFGGMQHDVTELVETRAALAKAKHEIAERHAFTLGILESLQIAIVTTDTSGTVTFANRAACGLLGTVADACVGHAIADVLALPPDAREWLATNAPGSARFSYVFGAGSGREIELVVSVRRAVDTTVEGVGHLFVVRDQAEMRNAGRVERLAAVATMAAGFAHEVRNPLASVRLFGEMLLGELPQDGEHHDLVGRMLAQVNRIERLVRTSLQFARPEKARLGRHWASVVVNGVLEALVPRLRKTKLELPVDIAENLPPIKCDDAQIVQVLVILVNNALDATNDLGPVRLEVRARSSQAGLDTEGEQLVQFAVIDEGPGIPAHLRETVFHPFFTTKPHGTGIGLTIAQQIAHENGGRIELGSGSRRGCVFSLFLPAAT